MARPQKTNLDFYRHDNDMRNDTKIKAIQAKFPNQVGYALYCKTLELLSESRDLKYQFTNVYIELMAGDFQTTSELLVEFIEYCVKLDLLQEVFYDDQKYITCDQLMTKHSDFLAKRAVYLEKTMVSDEKTELIQNKLGFPSRDKVKVKVKVKVKDKIKKEIEISEIDSVYNFYPSRCPINGRSTGKSLKCKDKIAKLISDGVDLKKVIEWYIADCKKTNTYLKNFATFLNNVPEMPTEQEQQSERSQPTKLNRTPLHLVRFKPYPKVEDDWTDEEFQEWSKKEQERIREMCSMKSGGANV